MARIAPLLKALATLQSRELGVFRGAASHPFLIFCALLLATQPASATFLVTLVGLVVFVPLASDPLRRVPPERLKRFPLSAGDFLRLRFLSLLTSPMPWAVAALLVWGRREHRLLALGLGLATLLVNLGPLLKRLPSPEKRLPIPRIRLSSPMALLVLKSLRERLHVLDPYLALLLALSGLAFRLKAPAPPGMNLGITLLILMALAALAFQGFVQDREIRRYERWPLPFWQVLLAKDLTFLLLVGLLVAPFAPLPGLAGAWALLAAGRHSSLVKPLDHPRWRFVITPSPGAAAGSLVALGLSFALIHAWPWPGLALCGVAWGLSLAWGHRRLQSSR
ncbi:MAG: hypothetical protein LWX11_03155 [Firmicutes bacterium]|nr:hypothetical protein [Bacillota bacterium]